MYAIYNSMNEWVTTRYSERGANQCTDELGEGSYWVWFSA